MRDATINIAVRAERERCAKILQSQIDSCCGGDRPCSRCILIGDMETDISGEEST